MDTWYLVDNQTLKHIKWVHKIKRIKYKPIKPLEHKASPRPI